MFKCNLSPDIAIKLTKVLCKWWLEGWVEAGEKESRKLALPIPMATLWGCIVLSSTDKKSESSRYHSNDPK